MSVRYIICDDNLFVHEATGGILTFSNMKSDTMELLVGEIIDLHGIPSTDLVVELYSKEGYPLCLSEQNVKREFSGIST